MTSKWWRCCRQYGGPILLFADRKFSREEESEADMLGMYNAIRAGYDPQGLIAALARLSQIHGKPYTGGKLSDESSPSRRAGRSATRRTAAESGPERTRKG